MLQGQDSEVCVNPLAEEALDVVAGKNTLHRVSAVRGASSRLIAVYSFYVQPGVLFTTEELIAFYGRSG